MDEERFLGIDYGGRRIGVAISDLSGSLASSLETLIVADDNDAIKQLTALFGEYRPVGIVIGLPLNLSGTESELSQRVKDFASKLKRHCDVPLYFEDERLSSRMAENILHSQGKKMKGHKEKVDRIAAAVILQGFLDRRQASSR